MGDGHLANPDKSYDKLTTYNSEIRITDGYKKTFTALSKFFENLFMYKPNIYSELSKTDKRFYRFVIKSKPLHRFFMAICEIPTGRKYEQVDIPRIIKNSPLNLQRLFIIGFCDADGCLRLAQNKYPEISISQLNPAILHSIIDVSKKFNIKWSGPYKNWLETNQGYFIRISKKEEVEKFLKTFPPLNPIKINQSLLLWEKLQISQ